MRENAAGNLTQGSDQDFPIIATMRATGRQRKIPLFALLLLVVLIAITLPFADIQLARIDAFLPVVQTVMCLADFLTRTLPERKVSAGGSDWR